MQASTLAFYRRGVVVCAAASLFLASTFIPSAALGAPASDPVSTQPPPAQSPAATPAPSPQTPSPAVASESGPGGLAVALKRDLGMSVDEFNAQGQLAAKAAAVQQEVTTVDPSAVVSLNGNTITVHTEAAAADAAHAASEAAGIAGLTVAPSQPANSVAKVEATSVDALFSDYVKAFGAGDLFSVARNASGEFVIRTGRATTSTPTPTSFAKPVSLSVAEFAAQYPNVTVEAATGPAEAHFAPGDPYNLVNGQGYFASVNASDTNGWLCSAGFNAFDKSGHPAVISAGHCAEDGAAKVTTLTNPATDTAATNAQGPVTKLTPLGSFAFQQFGGVNNAWTIENPDGTADGNIGTDVSVIDGIAASLTPLPAVAHWSNASSWNPATPEQISQDPANVQVSGVTSAVLGAPVCKSGRTTGWTCGAVNEIGVYVIAGIGYPSQDNPTGNPLDVRAVRGFASFGSMASGPGDSGGPVISGTTAVGLLSAGGQIAEGVFASISADLPAALAATDGYSIKIFLNAPVFASSGPVYRQGAITGTVPGAPAGTTVDVTIDGTTTTVPLDASGAWTLPAPNKLGTFPISVVAHSGFNSSLTTTASVDVVLEPLPEPAIAALPAAGTSPVSLVTGTGRPGATVTLTISSQTDAARTVANNKQRFATRSLASATTFTTVVDTGGTWTIHLSPALGLGSYTATITQTLAGWADSPVATLTFSVIPTAPASTTLSDNQQIVFNPGPTTISGTNLPGATITLLLNGQSYTPAVNGSTWSLTLNDPLAPGVYTLVLTQSLSGVTSAPVTSTFTVLSPPVAALAANPSSPLPLANTGVPSSVAGLGAAGILLLMSGAIMLFRRRSRTL